MKPIQKKEAKLQQHRAFLVCDTSAGSKIAAEFEKRHQRSRNDSSKTAEKKINDCREAAGVSQLVGRKFMQVMLDARDTENK